MSSEEGVGVIDNVEEPQEDVEVPRSTSEVDESSVGKMVKRKRSNDSEDEGDANLEAKKPKSEGGPSSGHNELCPIISQTEDSLVVEIPHDRVGQIIGTKGMIIQDIQARSGCQAKVNQDFPPGVPRQMEFRGTKATIAAGLDLVKRILEFGPQSIHANTVFGGPQITTTMDCPMSIVGKVIGTGGQTIKEIQSKSGAKVQIYQDFPPDQPRKLEITGSANAVGVAVNLIQTIMTGGNINGQGGNANTPRSSGQSAGTYSQGHTPRGHNQHQQQQPQHMHQQHHQQHQQHYNPPPAAAPPAPVPSYQAPPDARQAEAGIVIEVQKMLVGKIIGKGGENIVNLKRKSGCQIVVDQNVPEGYPCRVNISGVPYNIELARKLIEDIQMGVHMSKLGANLPPPISTGSGMSQAGPPMAPQPVYGAYPVQSYGVPPTSMPAQPAYAAYGAYPSAPPAVATYPYGGVPQPSPAPAPYSYPPYQQQPHAHAQPQQQQQHHHHGHSTTPRGSASHKPAPAAPQPNANVWTEYKDDEGRSYWYNSTTGTSQWEPPSYKK